MSSRLLQSLLATLLVLCLPLSAWTTEYFDNYGLTPASATVDLGGQPLGYPSGVISSVMRRDRILKTALNDNKQPLKTHSFYRGADMLSLLGDDRLEAGLLGDMPTILAAANGGVWIVGLVKQTSTAIVTKGVTRISALAGKRIGYVANSSAHHTLLQGLSSASLTEAQVKLVALPIDQMPDALERGEIDAFAAWEPAPSIALNQSTDNRTLFRGTSTDYFVISRNFERRSPEAARHLVAGFMRAIAWLQRSPQNLEKAAGWVLTDGQMLTGKTPSATIAQIASITRRDILNIPSAPAITIRPGNPPLHKEFIFLSAQGKLPAGAKWEHIQTAFTYDGLAKVLADAARYRPTMFDYED